MLPRIHTNTPLDINQIINLSKEATHHLVTVLRMKPGDTVRLFNGAPGDYEGEILSIHKVAQLKIIQFIASNIESPLSLHLGQGISKGDRMDFTIQKATELGVNSIIPIITEKCQVKLKEDRTAKKITHWDNIIKSAAEQSGRTQPPILNAPITLNSWLEFDFPGLSLVLDPNAKDSLNDIQEQPKLIRILIGPESGLSDKEIIYTKSKGFKAIKLGPRILRTETAGLAVITALQYQFGDFC